MRPKLSVLCHRSDVTHPPLTLRVVFVQVAAGREWFIHTIYTVRSKQNANRNIGKRSVEYVHHSMSAVERPARQRRAAPPPSGPELARDIGLENSRGTNIQHIALERADRLVVNQRQPWSPNRDQLLERPLLESSGREPADSSTLPMLVGLGGLVLLVCLIATIVVLLLLRRKRREKKTQFPPYATSSSAAYSSHSQARSVWGGADSSEV